MKKILFFIGFFVLVSVCKSQIQVKPADDNNFTPVDLIKNVFLGQGVQVIDIKYDGKPKSVGYFTNAKAAVNINSGILMTTGEAAVASLPNNSENTQTKSSYRDYFDQQLADAINSNILYDICRYEITFIPFSDSVRFNYVFASEEYPEFICSQYNDAFGFFISGANPDGGDYVNKNIALVPNTTEPVSINNIHPYKDDDCKAKNEQYYNTNPLLSPTMTYDAYLDVFVASAKVVPCTEYTIKLVIADVVDDVYDSAVFLEAKSFSTNALKVSLNTPSFDGTISEGCSSAELVFSFDLPVDYDYDLEMRLLNDPGLGVLATESVDFSQLPVASAKILKGKSSYSFTINAFPDNIEENEEIIALEYRKNVCQLDTLILRVVDNKLVNINLQDSISICEGDTVNVEATLPNDYEPPPDRYFSNNNDYIIGSEQGSEIYSVINVSGINPDVLHKEMLKKICIDTLSKRVLSDFDIYLVTPDNNYFELSTDNGFKPNASGDIDSMIHTCFTPDATVNINNGNPALGYYFPLNPKFEGDFQPEGNWDDLWGGKINGEWKLLVINDEKGWTGKLDAWHLALNSNYDISYDWSPGLNISCTDCLSPDIYPEQSGYYYVELKDTYGCTSADSIYAGIVETELVPYLNCDSVSVDFIRFVWGVNKTGETYEVRINNTDPWISVSDTFYNVTGLNFDETVEIEVRIAGGICLNKAVKASCTTYPCPPPGIELISKVDVKCYGDQTGQIQLKAYGTAGPYQYRHKNEINNSGFFDNLSSGIDTIYIIDNGGCEIPYVFEIKSAPAIIVDLDINNISCFGAGDGSILATATGGNGDFQFRWENSSTGNILTGNYISGLGSSTYYLTVTDIEGCSMKDTVIITEPMPLQINSSVSNVECKGFDTGMILIDVEGGTGEYKYYWETPVGTYTGKDLINIPAGTYNLTVTDENDCEIMQSFTVTEPAEGLAVDFHALDTLCNGMENGWIALDIPDEYNYMIHWSTGDTRDSIYNLQPGIYKVTISDNTGCVKEIEHKIVELDSIGIQIGFNAPTCHDDSDGEAWIEKVFYGSRETGKNNFIYKWNTNPQQSGLYAFGLKGGKVYSVYAQDKYGCGETETIFIPNPDKIKIRVDRIKDVSCYGLNDGRIDVIQDEEHPLNFTWSSNVPVKNNGSADSLKAGLYKLTVTDEKGCEAVKSFSITQPQPLQVSYNIKDVNCKGGSDGAVEAKISGGTSPYIFIWEDEYSNTKVKALSAGEYFVKIIDFNNCEFEDSVFVNEPAEYLESAAETKGVICAGGSNGEILFIDSGGIPPYSHKVLNDDFYAGDKLIGLKGGKYTVVTRDVNGCTDTLYNIVISEPDPLILDIGEDTLVDYGSVISLNSVVENGTPPYSYTWIIPDSVNASCTDCPVPEIQVYYNLQVQLTITDRLGCTAEDEKNILVALDKGIFVPTAFIPGGNRQENKKLYVYGKSGTKIKVFKIYDRWGGKVYQRNNFEVNDESEGWDGTFRGEKLNSGVFSWYIEIENLDGTTQSFKGLVTLLR